MASSGAQQRSILDLIAATSQGEERQRTPIKDQHIHYASSGWLWSKLLLSCLCQPGIAPVAFQSYGLFQSHKMQPRVILLESGRQWKQWLAAAAGAAQDPMMRVVYSLLIL